jgi:hypothetical protein
VNILVDPIKQLESKASDTAGAADTQQGRRQQPRHDCYKDRRYKDTPVRYENTPVTRRYEHAFYEALRGHACQL